MGRKTHLPAVSGRSRSELREYSYRKALSRWKRTKQWASDWDLTQSRDLDRNPIAPIFTHPDAIRRNPSAHPQTSWFVRRSLHQFTRNLDTYCSCLGCSSRVYDRELPRSVQRMQWLDDVDCAVEDTVAGRKMQSSSWKRRHLK